MPSHTFSSTFFTLAALTLVVILPISAKSSSSNQDLSNCSQIDNRLPNDWSCSSNRACISVDNAGAVVCCPPAYGCARLDQQTCSSSDPFWKDRVRTYAGKDPRISCPNSGLCCPVGYQCIDAMPREASYCVLNRASAIYPKALDPDDWQNCENDCNRYDACCPDMCQGNQCTKTATVAVRWVSISPAQATMIGGSAETSSSSTSSSEPSTTEPSSSGQVPLTGQSSSSSTSTSGPTERTTTPEPSSTPSDAPQTSSSNPRKGNVIAGALVGGLMFLCALLGLVYCLRKRQRNNKAIDSSQPDAQAPDGDHHTTTPGNVPQPMGSPHMSVASPVTTATSTTLVNRNDSCQRSGAPVGVIYPFIREDSSEPLSPVTAAPLESEAGSGGKSSRDQVVEHVRDNGLMSAGEGPTHRSDPNGSEIYEMQRWGKSIKQTNID